MIKEILKSDVGILNKYFLVTLILVLLTIVGYTSYALFSYEEISSTGIRIKYTGSLPELPQSEGNLANGWKSKTVNGSSHLAVYTLGRKNLPETYIYNGETYTLNTTIDVSEQGNGNVILGEYTNGSNTIAVIGQDGKVMAPANSSYLFQNGQLEYIDLSNLDTSNVTRMSMMFCYCTSLTSLDISSFNTSKVQYYQSMFYGCSSLTIITVGCNWTITTQSDMFAAAGTSSVTKVCNE